MHSCHRITTTTKLRRTVITFVRKFSVHTIIKQMYTTVDLQQRPVLKRPKERCFILKNVFGIRRAVTESVVKISLSICKVSRKGAIISWCWVHFPTVRKSSVISERWHNTVHLLNTFQELSFLTTHALHLHKLLSPPFGLHYDFSVTLVLSFACWIW